MPKFTAVHRIERRIDGKTVITEPGELVSLKGDEAEELLALNAIRETEHADTDTVAPEKKAVKGGKGAAKATKAAETKPSADTAPATEGEGEGALAADAADESLL